MRREAKEKRLWTFPDDLVSLQMVLTYQRTSPRNDTVAQSKALIGATERRSGGGGQHIVYTITSCSFDMYRQEYRDSSREN